MEPTGKIGQRFEKWDASNWLSVEREISAFQRKVADTMVKLGSFEFVPDLNPCLQDESVLGDELYLQIVRPRLYKLGYVPKEKKGEIEKKVEDDSDEEQEEEDPQAKRAKEVKETKQDPKDKKKAKKEKVKKAPPPKKQDLMKQKIVRENFAKQIQVVFGTFSPQKMQIDYGFRQKKLELKISTFFYIAYFIRKNKVKHQIDESLIYELINILIKVHRIFKNYEGKSFLDSSAKIKLSQRCMHDLKECLDSLRQYYDYNIKSVITKYPKLVYYTIYDHYFPTLDIKPYSSQIEFIDIIKDALKKDRPTMVFYKTMIGSGKTTTSISIANLISELKFMNAEKYKKMQLLYCCVIKSVRTQVGRLAYNQKIKFALGAMDSIKNKKNWIANVPQNLVTNEIEEGREYFPRVVNSFSCGEAEYVDLIVTDLHTTKSYLNEPNLTKKISLKRLGQFDRENLILFIDEPTVFCDQQSKVTKKLFEILAEAPPKIIIFASATMPDRDQLPRTIELVKMRNPGLQTFEVSSREFQIGCQFCTFQGQIIHPHSQVKNKQELEETISLLKKNPFLMRLYTGPSLFTLLDRCKKAGLKKLPKLQSFLEIRQTDILTQTLGLLEQLKQQDDKVIEEVCSVDKETENVAVQEKDSDQEEEVFTSPKGNYVNLRKLLRSDAYKFLGGCLIATADPVQFAKNTFNKWIDGIPPIKRLLERYEKDKEILRLKLQQIEESKNIRADEKLIKKAEIQNEFEPKFNFPDHKKINTVAHYQKYCKNKSPLYHSKLIRPIIIENVGFELFSQVEDWIIQLLFCGVALYSKTIDSAVYQNKVDDLAASGFLAYIICDESLCYGTNFPISNVILTDSLAQTLSINDMFQLIGRAGRVGQSWTARAFLEEKGASKLKDYIRDKDKAKYSNEAKVFQAMASELIANPRLFFKNKNCIVKPHLTNFRPLSEGQQIDVVIRHQRYNEIIKRINIVAHRKNAVLSSVFEIKEAATNASKKTYKFPSTRIYSTDIPTITNSEGYQVYDVEFFYKNDEEFIRSILRNAINRTLAEQFGQGKVKILRNEFSFNKYQKFFDNGTYTAIIEFESPDTLKSLTTRVPLEYAYHEISTEDQKNVLSDINVKELGRLSLNNPQDIDKSLRQNSQVYRQYCQYLIDSSRKTAAIFENPLKNKNFFESVKDLEYANIGLFAVDRFTRNIWPIIVAEIEKY